MVTKNDLEYLDRIVYCIMTSLNEEERKHHYETFLITVNGLKEEET